jgi:hypothetical protein
LTELLVGPRGGREDRTGLTSTAPPRSSAETAPVAPACLFERADLAAGESGRALTASLSTFTADGADDCLGPCAPSLNSTCGFAVQRLQADGSSRCVTRSLGS